MCRLVFLSVSSGLFFDDSDSEPDGEDAAACDPSEYEHLFKVTVGSDTVYLEDPTCVNTSGWTPLHTCCMSFLTVAAGVKLVEESVRVGANLDVVTKLGPGTFNREWTALQMACAYGVEPLVDALIKAGQSRHVTSVADIVVESGRERERERERGGGSGLFICILCVCDVLTSWLILTIL